MMRKKRSDLSSSTIKSCVPVVDEWTDGERKIICQVFSNTSIAMMRKKRSDLSSSTIKSCVPVVDGWTAAA